MMQLGKGSLSGILESLYDGVYFADRERRIGYWNSAAEEITGFSADEVLGRHCAANILSHTDLDGSPMCTSRCPAADTMEDGSPREVTAFLRHKAGHRVPVRIRTLPLRDADGTIVGVAEIFGDHTRAESLHERMRELERMALLDPLTGMANRRYLDIRMRARFDEMDRYGWSFSFLFLDIDHFKRVNDDYGHAIGDEVLCTVARTLSSAVRSFDVVGRWGGEEFAVLAPCADAASLRNLAERLRALVEQSSVCLANAPPLKVTTSIGATVATREDTCLTLVERADQMMYQSKRKGRNRITLSMPEVAVAS